MCSNMMFNKKNVLLSLLLINIIGLILLQFVVDTNIWLDVYFILWFFLSLIIWIIIYQKIKKINKEIVLPIILFINFVFYAYIDVVVRPINGVVSPQDLCFKILWLILKISLAIFIVFLFYSSLEPHIKKDLKLETFWRKNSKNKLFHRLCIIILVFLIFNQTLFFFPLTLTPIRNFKVDQNSIEIEKIVDEITENMNTDLDKTMAIYEWFNSSNYNIFNMWRPPALKSIFGKDTFISLRVRLPYLTKVCVRCYDDSNPLWILTSRTGNCGEYAKLFTEMAHRAGLEARTIRPEEMDHVWNEVRIDGDWIVVDPSRFWFNPDPYCYENESGNFSYVYAEGPWSERQNKTDVTSNYTDVATVNITTLDIEHNLVPFVDIVVYSNNENGGKTELSFKTNETGYYQVKMGGGTVTFECRNASLVNSTKKTLFENEYYDLFIELEYEQLEESEMVPNILLNISVVIIIFLTFILASIFIKKKKNEIKSWIFVRNSCWLIGGAIVVFATGVMNITLGTGGFAIFTLGFAIHSIVLSLKSEQRIKNLEKQEIFRKLSMFKEENNSNISLINDLIKKKEKYYPEKLLKKKLRQKPPKKYQFTQEEIEILSKAGVWIPKAKISYDSALHVLEIAHHLDDNFITNVREYIEGGKELNVHKDFCQQWIIARNGIPNPDETWNYYKSLDNAKKIITKIKKSIKNELEKNRIEK